MIARPLASVDRPDIDQLLLHGRVEDRQLEYKRVLPGGSDDDKREFLADVASFANAVGGDMLFGIEESAGVPQSIPGVKLEDFDSERLRLQSLIRDGIQPRIPAVEFKEIPGFDHGPVLIVRIHQSWAAPHVVSFKNLSRFYIRSAGQRHQMDVDELRVAFLGNEALAERLSAFRNLRLGRVIAGETPAPIAPHPTLMIHVLPIGHAFLESRVDPRVVGDRWERLVRSQFVRYPSRRYNLDGLAIANFGTTSKFKNSYIQVFRNGAVEAATTFSRHDEPAQHFFGQHVESWIVKFVDDVRAFWQQEGLESDLVVMLSFLRMRGISIATSASSVVFADHRTFEIDTVLLPDTLVDGSTHEVSSALRTAFDALWQAADLPASPSYDKDGMWHAPQY